MGPRSQVSREGEILEEMSDWPPWDVIGLLRLQAKKEQIDGHQAVKARS